MWLRSGPLIYGVAQNHWNSTVCVKWVIKLNSAFQMPRWLSGLDYILGLLDRWIDSLYCSYFCTFFCNITTNALRYCCLFSFFAAQRLYCDIVTYSMYDSVGSLCPAGLHPRRTGLPCTQSCSADDPKRIQKLPEIPSWCAINTVTALDTAMST